MRNKDSWKPSKFIYNKGVLRGSKDQNELSIATRLSADNNAKLLQDNISKFASGVLLDLGCGKVPLFEIYEPLVSEIICTDWSLSYHNNIHWDFVTDLNKSLPLPKSSVDTVILSSVLEHISNPNNLINELQRIVRSNGHVILAVPFLFRLHEEPWDYFRFTKYGLAQLFNKNNFEVVSIQETGGVIEVILTMLMQFHYRRSLGIIFQLLYQVFKLILRIPIMKLLSRKSSNIYPLGYVVVAKKLKV